MANKKRRCRNCKKYSLAGEMRIGPDNGAYCNTECMVEYAFKNRDKGKQNKHREQKKELRRNDIKIRKAAAKKACHDYIRARDYGKPCICCGRELGNKFDAGHYLESGNNPRIRYHEDNIHGQSVYCNQFQGGNSDDYRGRLIEKIGLERVERLESMKGGTLKRTADDYLKIEKYYKSKLKRLESV